MWTREGWVKQVTDTASDLGIEYVYDADGGRLIELDEFDGLTTLHVGTAQLKVKAGVKSTVRTYSQAGEPVVMRSDPSGLWVKAVDSSSYSPTSRGWQNQRQSYFTPGSYQMETGPFPTSGRFTPKILVLKGVKRPKVGQGDSTFFGPLLDWMGHD